METTFTIRPYGKTELALAYTHGVMSPRSSLNWFNREIAQYPGLLDRLKELGYRTYQNTITIAQLRTIIQFIGTP